jgi:hypothetical protein
MTTSNNHEQTKTTSGKPLTEGTSLDLEEALADLNLFRPHEELLEKRGYKTTQEWIDSLSADPFPKSFGLGSPAPTP